MKSFWTKFGKFFLSFSGGALAAAVASIKMGQVNPMAVGVAAAVGGLTTVLGHAAASPLQK